MSNRRFGRIALALGVGAIFGGLASFAGAQGEDAATEPAPIHPLCADQHPCVIVNGAADPAATGDEAHLVTPEELLDDAAKPPSACPAADAAYEDIGVEPDAFVGRCPRQLPPADSAIAAETQENFVEAMDAQGGSR
jgi:hypothetical protein